MITGSINLRQLKSKLAEKDGKKYVVIPVEENKLFLSEKGGVYMNLVAFEIKNPSGESKDTHIVKQSFTKEERQAMSDEQARSYPIIGNLRVFSNEPQESAPQESAEVTDDFPF